uniref:Ferritin heavy chain n=1 Tax=Aedes aegypti TaxID=7159 RepID=FRIH_AEDAE|nr:RecName: Full=Ferritin heavy chain; AltName: Full=AeFer(H); AltName: Full=Ferritin heavy chain-like protein; Flags: Precursor [Aedes aegypti]
MMKSVFFGVVAITVAILSIYQETAQAQEQTVGATDNYQWDSVDDQCLAALHRQINKEFDASIIYLKYAAYFAQEKINLPGFEKFFFHSAAEEREHGIKLIEYALMRGKAPVDKHFKLNYDHEVPTVTTGESALETALQKEVEVTKSIRGVIKACEDGSNDFHLADYLTGEYLDEQHKGQRELAEKIATLKKMKKSAPKLGEFLFDKNHM